jgi:ribulose bisphosphate carboxylase small subunit
MKCQERWVSRRVSRNPGFELKVKKYNNHNNMPTTTYKNARVCECGYSTFHPGNWSTHKRTCKIVTTSDKDHIATLKKELEDTKETYQRQLAVKDEQLAAKDRQIEQLIKKPRTVNNTTNNRYVVEQHINVFGKESINHITPAQIRSLLADPVNAVPQFIKLKYRRAPGGVNNNVRIPKQKRAIYQVVVQREDGEKQWENQAKGDVLEQLYDDNSGELEVEADEDTREGLRFLDHQDRVKESASGTGGGRRYKEQLDKIHCVISN